MAIFMNFLITIFIFALVSMTVISFTDDRKNVCYENANAANSQ